LTLALLALAVAPGLPACKDYSFDYGWGTSDRDVRTLDVAALRAMLAEPRPPVLVDVRPSAAEFEAGRLPGAVHIPLPELAADHPALRGADRVVVYADDQGSDLASVGAKKLIAGDVGGVYAFRGGLTRWNREQPTAPEPTPEPAEKDDAKPKPASP
jgi:rhodanese-related sulfurtransferase